LPTAGNGQIKLGRDGDYCVSQQGGGSSGGENVALYAAASASSTADALAHGAGMAVDGRPDTFWASRFGDVDGPVEFSIDFGAERSLESAEISWAYAAKGFSIALYSGGAWAEVPRASAYLFAVAPFRSRRVDMGVFD
jgi:hypothetical protein